MDDFSDDSFGFPDEEYMACEDGLFENHHYRDLRGFDRSDFERIAADEQQLLDYDGDPNEDDAYDEIGENEVWMLDLDPGVATSVLALRAVGAVPYTCCNGDPGHFETHPLVAFWATRDQMKPILAAAKKTGVEVDPVSSPGFLVYTHGHVELMMAFARELVASTR